MVGELLVGEAANEARPGALAVKLLEDGRELTLYPMTFGKTRLCIGDAGAPTLDDFWCYEGAKGLVGIAEWDGVGVDPPGGWHRHGGSGRRRPDGDASREYVMR